MPHSMSEHQVRETPSSYIEDRWLHDLDWNASLDCLMTEQTWGLPRPWNGIRARA
jgi:hypothetical protein